MTADNLGISVPVRQPPSKGGRRKSAPVPAQPYAAASAWRNCPQHPEIRLRSSVRPGEAHLCPVCARIARKASYARQKAEIGTQLEMFPLAGLAPRPVSKPLPSAVASDATRVGPLRVPLADASPRDGGMVAVAKRALSTSKARNDNG
jgi:hypothetical protein